MTDKRPFLLWLDTDDVNLVVYYLFLFENDHNHEEMKNDFPNGIPLQIHLKTVNDFLNILKNIDFTETILGSSVQVEQGEEILLKYLRSKQKKFLLETGMHKNEHTLEHFISWLEIQQSDTE